MLYIGCIPLPEWLFPVKKKSRVNREDVESQTYIPYDETKRQLVGFLLPLQGVTQPKTNIRDRGQCHKFIRN